MREYNLVPEEPGITMPRHLGIMAGGKMGKTTILADLTTKFARGDSMIISIGHEKSYGKEGIVEATNYHFEKFKELEKFLDDLNSDQPCTFVGFDNLSVLEQMCKVQATLEYMQTNQGKSFNFKTGKNIGSPLNSQNHTSFYMPGSLGFKTVESLSDGAGK